MEKVLDKKQITFNIIKYLSFAFCFFIFFNAKLFGLVSPFAPALLFALVWCGQNIWALSCCYLISSIKNSIFIPSQIVINIFTVTILIVCALIQKRSKRNVTKPLFCLYFVLSMFGRFVFVRSVFNLAVASIEIVLSLLLLICYSIFFEAILNRKSKIKLNTDEFFCAGVFLISLASALASLKFLQIDFGIPFILFLVLLSLTILGFSKGIVCSLLLGFGYFIVTKNIYMLSTPLLFALVCGVFTGINTIVSSLAGLLILSTLGFYFNFIPNFSIYQFLVCLAGIIPFALISKKSVNNLKSIFADENIHTSQTIIKFAKKINYFKFTRLAKAFEEMNKVYKGLIKKSLSQEESAYMLAREVQNRMCNDCPNKKVCFRESGKDMLNELYDMFLLGVKKKEINLIDIPNKINMKCENNRKLLSLSNNLLESYVKYDTMQTEVNASKIMVSESMESIAAVLEKFAQEEEGEVKFNKQKEKEIFQNLIYSNLSEVSQVCVAEEKENIFVLVTMFRDGTDVKIMEREVSKTMKVSFEISEIIKDPNSKAVSYVFTQGAKCDLVFGVASEAKSGEICGDSHTFVKLSPSKFMIGICDGMGTGVGANEISDKTIGLIENYYKAGFSSDEIISNINKLYLSGDEEKFSALDLCVFDLNKLDADFIKLGSPQTFIKRKNETKVINGGSLPIGTDEKQTPKLSKSFVEPKDLIFMVSDGVSDSFSGEDELSHVIASLKGDNPQELADKLLEIAKSKRNDHPDDMTVFVSRVYKKVQ